MASPKLQAAFFVSSSGVITPKHPAIQETQRHRIFIRDGELCKICGEKTKFGGSHVSPFQKLRSGHIDHIFPRARGGSSDDSNLRLLCLMCNASKGAR